MISPFKSPRNEREIEFASGSRRFIVAVVRDGSDASILVTSYIPEQCVFVTSWPGNRMHFRTLLLYISKSSVQSQFPYLISIGEKRPRSRYSLSMRVIGLFIECLPLTSKMHLLTSLQLELILRIILDGTTKFMIGSVASGGSTNPSVDNYQHWKRRYLIADHVVAIECIRVSTSVSLSRYGSISTRLDAHLRIQKLGTCRNICLYSKIVSNHDPMS